ncbi:unnamed protein product [Gadus morhua 'NCC']
MVHSGANAPLMPTTPSASPLLAVSAQPLHSTHTDEGLTEPSGDLITSSSDATEAPQVKPAPNDHPESGPGSPLSPDQFQAAGNGRSSGRKRTPKACDCCGPNGKGHNVTTTPTPSRGGRGRGRPRGRGRGRPRGRASGPLGYNGDTPKGTGGGHLTRIKTFELNDDDDDEDEDSDKYDVAKGTGVDGQSDTYLDLPGESAWQDGPMKSLVAKEIRSDSQEKGSALVVRGGRGQRRGRGAAGLRGARGRGAVARRGRGASVGRTLENTGNIEGGGGGGGGGELEGSGVVIAGAACVAAQKVFAPAGAVGPASPGSTAVCQGPEEMEQGESPASDLLPSSATNGNGVHFSEDGEARESEANADAGAPEGGVGAPEKGAAAADPAVSEGSAAAAPPPGDQDSAMQVDPSAQASDPTSSSTPPPPPDGDAAAAAAAAVVEMADPGGSPAHTETPAFHTARSPAPSLESIAVQSGPHGWGLLDHRQYCLQGTWGPGDQVPTEAGALQIGPQTSETDCTELLTEMLHEFLEGFFLKYGSFIPLSETDVLEHLKTKTNMDLSKRKLDIPGEIRRFKAGLASAPVAGFMVTYNKHTLSLEDLGTLEEQNWVNDQVINMYGELIMEATQSKVHFFNSFFHKQLVAKGYDGVKRWTKKVDLFSKWLLLVPIHLEIHWSLITVNTATKTISYYDSQGVVFKHTIDNIMKYLQSEALEKKQTNYQKGWRMLIIRGIPQQKNDSDCGVFVLEYCRRLSMKEPLHFSQEDMPHIRKRIYKELCDYRLND